jgi:L-threonylcarbamoyladenylate synthase
MPIIVNLRESFEGALEQSVKVLNNGGLIVFPTDTVYGLASKFDQSEAIQRIYQVKGREQTKALPVLISNLDQIELISKGLSENAIKLARFYWPGALTVILEKREDLQVPLSMDNSIGIRIPDDPFVRNLAEQVGPLATTSANLSGLPNTTNIDEVLKQIGDSVDLIVDGGECAGGIPSTVVDCRGEEIKILREGTISKEEIIMLLISAI